MDPVSSFKIANTAADLSKKLFELAKAIKDRNIKQKLDEVLDELRSLKQQASELEDENRAIKEKARFNEDNYEFRNPFWFDKKHLDRALCPKCYSQKIAAPMSKTRNDGSKYCLVCRGSIYEIAGTSDVLSVPSITEHYKS